MARRKKLLNINRWRRQVDKVEKTAKDHQRKFFHTQTASEARIVRNQVIIWFTIIIALIVAVIVGSVMTNFATTTQTGVPGGNYVEGIVGDISSFNPILAETEDEKAVSSLVYSSLLKTDETNSLTGDLASSWVASSDGLTYTVTIRDDVKWQETGQPVTVDDVIFTIKLIKDPLVKSPLASTWSTIKANKSDDSTIVFELKTPIASFPWALTFGILPQEELKDINPGELREYLSEHKVRGSGPFSYHSSSLTASGAKILLFSPNSNYHGGTPKVDSLHITSYPDIGALAKGYENGEINVATDIDVSTARYFSQETHITPIYGEMMVLFNLDSSVLGSTTLRNALRLGIDRDLVRLSVAIGDQLPTEAETPLSPWINDESLVQPLSNKEEADHQLTQLGYIWDKDLKRVKDGAPLRLNIATVENSDYEIIANNLAEQWRELGIEADVTLTAQENIQESVIIPRNYDVLVYQLQLGGDGDVYAYWHSSGAKSGGLNLSAYKSPVADLALTRARTQINPENRLNSYNTFARTWLDDVPAITLYQANLYYLSSDDVRSWGNQTLIDKSVRFRGVVDFTTQTATVNKTP